MKKEVVLSNIEKILSENTKIEISDANLISRHAECIYQLYDELGLLFVLEEDAESLESDIEHDYLSLMCGWLGHHRPSGVPYDPNMYWWWYMDDSRNMAISVETGAILPEKTIVRDMQRYR